MTLILRLFFVYDTNFLYDQQNWASPLFSACQFTKQVRVILPTIAEYIQLSDTLFVTLNNASGRAPKRLRERVDWSKFLYDMINDSTFTFNTRHGYVPSNKEELSQIGEIMKE